MTTSIRSEMAVTPAEEAPEVEPLQYQTLVLKVSIHCRGCKERVEKILKSIDGVYTIAIDSQQHKVTVLGNVDGGILLKKLLRAGKQAEIWPEPKQTAKKEEKSKEKSVDHEKKTQGDDENEEGESLEETKSDVFENDGGETREENEAGGKKKRRRRKKKKKKKKSQNNNAHGNEFEYPDEVFHYSPPTHGLSYSVSNPSADMFVLRAPPFFTSMYTSRDDNVAYDEESGCFIM